jgi:hypothetical protein
MLKINEQKFLEMDELSLQKVPFFFVIDFLMENVLVFSQEDLEGQKILVDFPKYKNVQPFTFETKEVTWKSFPQSKEDYQKGFEIVQNHLKLGGILTTRFNAKTLVENRAFLENINSTGDKNHGIACIYCAPSEISEKIPIGSRCAVLEMDNDANMIIGIGLIENHAYKKRLSVYEWGYYNRVNYIGYFRIDRSTMTQEELKMMEILDKQCFKGAGHLKRGKGLTSFPLTYLYDLFEKGIDIDTFIREIFNRRFLSSSE